MKKEDFLAGYGSAWLTKKPSATGLPKGVVGLDNDIFAPLGAQRSESKWPLPLDPITSKPWSPVGETWRDNLSLQCFFQDAGLSERTSPEQQPRLPEGLIALPDGERQRFRELLSAALNRVSVLENIVSEQTADLSLCRSQISDLCSKHKEQAAEINQRTAELQEKEAELQAERDQSTQLNETIAALRGSAARQVAEITDAKQKFALAETHRLELQAKLDEALIRSDEMSHDLLEANMQMNDKETAVASIREQMERLQETLDQAQAEKRDLAGEIEELNHRHRGELADQRAKFEELFSQIKVVLAKRDQDVKRLENLRAALSKRCDELVKSIEVLKSSEQQLQAKIDSRTGLVGILESQLRTEREIAERRINDLRTELQRVRAEHAASERALEEMCRDITLLLPEFSARLGQSSKPKIAVAASRMRAA